MPRCVDCKHEGKYFNLKVPYMFGIVNIMGIEEITSKLGFTKDDLCKKGMHCQAPGGGPTQDPIALVQAIVDQPCSFFTAK
jgi:hypothetical protein